MPSNSAQENTTTNRYNNVAIILHWVIGLAIILMLASGFTMKNMDIPQGFKFNLFQWHKSLGVLILCAVSFRIAWRLCHKPPRLPQNTFSKFDIIAAKLGHVGLYCLMLALPLSGWVLVSSSKTGIPTFVFNFFQWPHIPSIEGNSVISGIAKDSHEIMAWVILIFIVLHIAATIKHAIIDKVNLLPRMILRCRNNDTDTGETL